MTILLVGATGMLGSDLAVELQNHGHEVLCPPSAELDITDPASIATLFSLGTKFDWCVNCAAYTAVDDAESHRDEATALNTLGPSYLARACFAGQARFIHISTDFVFDGAKSEPYNEDDVTNPLGVYGQTKLDGEEAAQAAHPDAIVFRTAWLYGPHGRSFPRTMVQAARSGRNLRVVSDQRGSPTYTVDLAKAVLQAIERRIPGGIYHATGPEAMTWHEFATLAIQMDREATGDATPVAIEAISAGDWPTPARRPANSVLSNAKLREAGIEPMQPVRAALAQFLARL